jgi:TRAP-type C4-dicarboxylate transport system substrate-binding protein
MDNEGIIEMKKWFKHVVPAMTLGAIALSSGATLAKTELVMSNWVPQGHWFYKSGLKPWADKIAASTEGRVTVRTLPKPLAGPAAHFDLARKGTADITWGNYGYQPSRFKLQSIFEMPQIGDNAEASSVAYWRVFQNHFAADPTQKGVKILGLFTLGGGAIHHATKSIVTLDDFKGQKIRIGGPVQKAVVEAMGGVAVGAPQTKSYEMITSKAVEATLSSWETVINFRLTKVASNHSYIPGGMFDATFFLAMNAKKFDSLSKADQDAIMKVSGEAFSRAMGQEFDKRNKAAMGQFKGEGKVKTVSAGFLKRLVEVRETLVGDWTAFARTKGYANPEKIISDFQAEYDNVLAGK